IRTPVVDDSDQAAEARALMSRVLAALGIEGRVDILESADALTVTCSGPDVAILIGRHGQTIDAVQYLLNAIAHRLHGEERKEVTVDAAGYRERRRSTLESLAVRTAQQGRAGGDRVGLDPVAGLGRQAGMLRVEVFA